MWWKSGGSQWWQCGELEKNIWTGLLLGTSGNATKRREKDGVWMPFHAMPLHSYYGSSTEASCTVIVRIGNFAITSVVLCAFIVN